MGGRGVREKVLSDQKVIAAVNRSFVPVWLNVKNEHLPADLPAVQQVPEDERQPLTGEQGFIARGFS